MYPRQRNHQGIESKCQTSSYKYRDQNRLKEINQAHSGRKGDHELGDDSSLHRPAKKFYFVVWGNAV
jgi:hypothetical protein